MPTVYRLVKEKFASDPLDASGARRYGGRWNSKGKAVVYASDSIALAALEILVHLHQAEILHHFRLCAMDLQDYQIMTLAPDALPDDWQDHPPPPVLQAIGDEWLERGESLALRVPSSVIPQQHNLLINPAYPDFPGLKESARVTSFDFDPRLAGKHKTGDQ